MLRVIAVVIVPAIGPQPEIVSDQIEAIAIEIGHRVAGRTVRQQPANQDRASVLPTVCFGVTPLNDLPRRISSHRNNSLVIAFQHRGQPSGLAERDKRDVSSLRILAVPHTALRSLHLSPFHVVRMSCKIAPRTHPEIHGGMGGWIFAETAPENARKMGTSSSPKRPFR